MKTYKIYLLRHGLTDANEKGLYIGRTDMPLSPSGLTHLLTMKKDGGYPKASRFFTSPLTRCRQTLEVLYPGCKPELVPGLAECSFGEWEGRSAAQLKTDDRFQQWIMGNSQDIPGGETAHDFQTRVMTAFESVVNGLIHSGDTEAVICTHGGVVMMIMAAYALPHKPVQTWMGQDGGGFALRVTPSLWMRQPVAELIGILPDVQGLLSEQD